MTPTTGDTVSVNLGCEERWPMLDVHSWGDGEGDYELPAALVQRWKDAETELDAATQAILDHVGKSINDL